MNWLLIFVPLAIGMEFAMPQSHTLIFLVSCIAIIPLAGWMGHATEELSKQPGEGAYGRSSCGRMEREEIDDGARGLHRVHRVDQRDSGGQCGGGGDVARDDAGFPGCDCGGDRRQCRGAQHCHPDGYEE